MIELRPDPLSVEHSQSWLQRQQVLVGNKVVVHDEDERDTQLLRNPCGSLGIIMVGDDDVWLPCLNHLLPVHHIGHVYWNTLVFVIRRCFGRSEEHTSELQSLAYLV